MNNNLMNIPRQMVKKFRHCPLELTKQDLITMFKDTPQEMADLVRSRGHKLYSDRITKSEKNDIVIT